MNERPSPRTWKSRWTHEQIRALVIEQHEAFWRRDTGTPREALAQVERAAPLPHAVVISGLRRAGKSTLLAQMAHRLGRDAFYYVNFEDERFLGFEASDANDLYEVLVELYGERHIFMLDEIQNVPGWERFVRRFMDLGAKFYITGSNAALLSQELGTRLTGRYVPIELFPFSFTEYLRFREIETPALDRLTTAQRAALQRALGEYLEQGGLPEPLKYPGLPLHTTLYNDILYRDIAARYHIGETGALKELALFLFSNPANLVSYNKLKEQLGLGSVNTVKSYIDYLQASWLLFVVNRHDYSVRRQQVGPKKVYGIDTGLLCKVGFAFSPNTGRLLENLVYLALRRRAQEIHYYVSATGREVDFYLPQSQELIQVAQDMNQPQVREREVRALLEAMQAFNLPRGLILSDTNLDPPQIDGATIEVRAISDWLLH